LLKVRFSGGLGTGNSLMSGSALTTDGKSGYFTVRLDLEVMSVMFVE
jgi:hypothetical protein